MSLLRKCAFDVKSVRRPLILQFSEKTKWRNVFSSRILCITCIKPFSTSAPKLIKYTGDSEWTDPNFSDRFKEGLKNPKNILIGLYNFAGEFNKLFGEVKESSFLNQLHFRFPGSENHVDMLYTFDSDNEINKFMVNTDSSQFGGYSSASFKMTPAKTGLFSGYISTEPVKDGEAKFTGYATLVSRKRLRSFKRIKYHDLSYYTHLVFKVRGDGRTYYIHFSVKTDFEQSQSWVYSFPLFTRGGPYWQVSKIAFSDFFFVSKGQVATHQPSMVPLRNIAAIGLTTRQTNGPFKLEIDYIGLELDPNHRAICPYEMYA